MGSLKSFFFIFLLLSRVSFAQEIKRDLLAFWDSSEATNGLYENSFMHRYFELIANHYGFKLNYFDLNKRNPSKIKLSNYAGVVSWLLDDQLAFRDEYFLTFKKIINSKKPFIVFSDFGFTDKLAKNKIMDLAYTLKKIGLDYKDQYFDNPLFFEVDYKKDPKLVEFERPLSNEISSFSQILVRDNKKMESWLGYSLKNDPKKRSDVVAVGKNFAWVQNDFVIYQNPQDYTTQWRVNPFKLIEKVFNFSNHPVIDTNVISGSRINYNHIDGDGFVNMSLIDRKSYSGQIILEKIIKKYSLPHTVSFVTAEIDSNYLGSKVSMEAAKEIMKYPYIEPASHTFTHPLTWSINPTEADLKQYLGKRWKKHKGGAIVAYKVPGYKMNYKDEILGSSRFIDEKILINKKTKVILWSGDCEPPESALKLAYENDLVNMNGGDGRMDKSYPSYSGLSSLYRKVGKYIQVYSSNSNENLYTNLWTGPFSGFADVIETFENTAKPRLIKPMNIYYHFYSGEHEASIKALEKIYEHVLSQEVAPIYVSDYFKIVNGFYKAKIEKIGKNKFLIKDYGKARTIRFENSNLTPDYKSSKNIVGHRVLNGVLYVYLGSEKESVIKLSKNKKLERPFISLSNAWIDKLELKDDKVVIFAESRYPIKGTLTYKNKNYEFSDKSLGKVRLEVAL